MKLAVLDLLCARSSHQVVCHLGNVASSKPFLDISPRGWKCFHFTAVLTGGAEHAVLHLLYARFWHKVLFDLGVVTSAEPFQRLVSQGMILGEVGPHFPSPTL